MRGKWIALAAVVAIVALIVFTWPASAAKDKCDYDDDVLNGTIVKTIEKITFKNGNIIIKLNTCKKIKIKYYDPDTLEKLGDFDEDYFNQTSVEINKRNTMFEVDDNLVIVRTR